MTKLALLPVILSGGAGTRLWPVSREGHPKPFMKLADGQSLLGKTYLRAARGSSCLQADATPMVLTVTNQNYYFLSRDVECASGVYSLFLLESFARNTSGAIALAAYQAIDQFGAEVGLLIGNPEKAKLILGWEPKTNLESLCQMMVDSDIKRNQVGYSF